MNRRTSRPLFLLLLFALQTFLPAFANCLGYTLNQAGHRTAVVDSRSAGVSPANQPASTRSIAYTYDKLYRLTSETISAPSGLTLPVLGTISYTHDKVGNRLSRTSSNTLLQSLLPNQSQSYNANDQLNGHSHDANGNTTQSPSPLNSITYAEGSSVNDVYDFRNKLIRRTLPDGSTIDLTYNADALLIAKTRITNNPTTNNSVHYLQDTNNHTGYAQIVEELSDGSVYALNVPGHDLLHTTQLTNNPITNNPEWSTHHYLYDGLGSVRALTNDQGQITDTFDYDAFGNLLTSTGDTPNAYLYTGERFDPDLGFYYLRARYHDTNLGRFHTLDTYEGRNGEPMTLHKYLYTHADPVNNTDPSGNLLLGLALEIALSAGFDATFRRIDAQRSSATGRSIHEALARVITKSGKVPHRTTRKLVQLLNKGFSKIPGNKHVWESHHVIPKALLEKNTKLLNFFGGNVKLARQELFAVPLRRQTHQKITGAFNSALAGVKNPTIKQIREIAKDVYKDHPDMLRSALNTLDAIF